MNLVGSIGFIAAAKNYLNAKKRYNEAMVKAQNEQSAILQTIDEHDTLAEYMFNTFDRNLYGNTTVEDLVIAPVLYFGYEPLSGRYYKAKFQILLLNTSTDKTITIYPRKNVNYDFLSVIKLFDEDAAAAGGLNSGFTIQPQKACVVTIPIGYVANAKKSGWMENLIYTAISKYVNGAIPKDGVWRKLSTLFKDTYYEYLKKSGQYDPLLHDNGEFIQFVPNGYTLSGVAKVALSFYYSDTKNQDIRRALYTDLPCKCVWTGKTRYETDELDWHVSQGIDVRVEGGAVAQFSEGHVINNGRIRR